MSAKCYSHLIFLILNISNYNSNLISNKIISIINIISTPLSSYKYIE